MCFPNLFAVSRIKMATERGGAVAQTAYLLFYALQK